MGGLPDLLMLGAPGFVGEVSVLWLASGYELGSEGDGALVGAAVPGDPKGSPVTTSKPVTARSTKSAESELDQSVTSRRHSSRYAPLLQKMAILLCLMGNVNSITMEMTYFNGHE